MANLLAALGNSAGALQAYGQVLQVAQNNVENAATPGYAKQRQTLDALPFDLALGDGGGVQPGLVESSRDEYAERAVRNQNTLLGAASQDVSSLTSLQTMFDISGTSGIPYVLNNLLRSFSAWAQSPNDSNARQAVIDHATELANTFNGAAAGISNVAGEAEQQIGATVTQVNQLVGRLQQYNVLLMARSRDDPALDAEAHSTLEQLSQYVDATAQRQDDGSWMVLLDGQIPLLAGARQFVLSNDLEQPHGAAPANVNGPPWEVVRAADGTDITAHITTGQLGSLLNFRNSVIASFTGDAYQQGSLNSMAQQFAERVNGLLEAGYVSDGPPPVPGTALFALDTANSSNAAASLKVDPAITASQLAAIDLGPPEVANGVPLALSGLANPQVPEDGIDGSSFSAFYGGMASRVGTLLSSATDLQQVQQSAVAQARNLRDQTSGVNYDEEAMTMLQFQRAYEANSRMISILNQITEEVVNLLGGR